MSVKKYLKESIKLGDKELTVETGRVAKQADGSVVIQYGDTMLLVAAVGAPHTREGIDFFPLTVEYREANYAAGRIPGNYFRREGRPTEKETLTSRLIDRPCRPLFAEGYKNETQVIASVISADPDNNPDVIAITGASCALYLSDIPFMNPIAGVRIGLIDGRYIVNPTYDETRESRLNLIVAGTEEAIVMVEAGASEVSEEIMVEALMLAHKEINRLCGIGRSAPPAGLGPVGLARRHRRGHGVGDLGNHVVCQDRTRMLDRRSDLLPRVAHRGAEALARAVHRGAHLVPRVCCGLVSLSPRCLSRARRLLLTSHHVPLSSRTTGGVVVGPRP